MLGLSLTDHAALTSCLRALFATHRLTAHARTYEAQVARQQSDSHFLDLGNGNSISGQTRT